MISPMALGKDAAVGVPFHSTDFSELPLGREAHWWLLKTIKKRRCERLEGWMIVGNIIHVQMLLRELNTYSLNGREPFWLRGQALAHSGHWSLLKRVIRAAGRHCLYPTGVYRVSPLL